MFWTEFALSAGANSINDRPPSSPTRRSPLSCVWIEIGDPGQPLVCIWIDREMRIAGIDDERELVTEPVPVCRSCSRPECRFARA